jgi:hypothetical protein
MNPVLFPPYYVQINTLGKNVTSGLDLQGLNSYFGSQIALYFAWLSYYSAFLSVPAVAGMALFCRQMYTGKFSNVSATLNRIGLH